MVWLCLIRGKICSEKSICVSKIKEAQKVIILSLDEIMLTLFGQNADDGYVTKAKSYSYKKSLEILDWGFWTKKEREYVKSAISGGGKFLFKKQKFAADS